VEPSQLNVTTITERDSIKWNAGGGPPLGWIEFSTPVPTTDTVANQPGLYEGARYCPEDVYRPTYDSAMRNLGRPFDFVNEELLVRRMYAFMSPLESSLPEGGSVTVRQGASTDFSVDTTNSESLSVNVTWLVDGVVAGSGAAYSQDSSDLSIGNHTVTAQIEDTSSRVRNDPDGLLKVERQWQLTVEAGDDELPGATSLISPSGDIDTSTPVYSWNAVTAATRYLLSVTNSSGALIEQRYNAADVGCADGNNACQVQPSTAVAGAVQWRVQTENDAGEGPWSDTLTFTVMDKPDKTKVNISSVTVNEADGRASVVVSLANAIAQACTVKVFSRPDSATPGEDFYGATEELSFAAGETSKEVSFVILADAEDEPLEQFIVAQVGSANCVPGTNGVVSIVNDDNPDVTPQVRLESTEISEAVGSVDVTVSLSQAGTQTCSVRISSRRDTATPGQDYFGSTQVLNFAAGEVSKTVTFVILDDTVNESSERFTVGQAATVNCIQGKDASVLILDNDV